MKPVYLDCNAAPPIDDRVRAAVHTWQRTLPANPDAIVHTDGAAAAALIDKARSQIAKQLDARAHEIIFTSGATESNNLSLLGLEEIAKQTKRFHIITTNVAHSSVLGVCNHLSRLGFTHTQVPVEKDGRVDPLRLLDAVNEKTLVVSLTAVNNVTGICQPVVEIANGLKGWPAYLHIDAAQAFGRVPSMLRHQGIDLMSVSGYKIYGPKGVGALLIRNDLQLQPLMFGGGQQQGLRPGSLPVPLIGGLGLAAQLAASEWENRKTLCQQFHQALKIALAPLSPVYFNHPQYSLPHVACFAIPGVDASIAIAALKSIISISRGSACATGVSGPSHVLEAMTEDPLLLDAALRISWCHKTPQPSWERVVKVLRDLQEM